MTSSLLSSLCMQHSGTIGDQIEGMITKCLNNTSTATEKADQKMGHVSGKRKVLLIGINYFGQSGELRGCINDVRNIKNFLETHYTVDEILILTDDPTSSNHPTRANILQAFRWLRQNASSGDSLILHYSGHGGSVKDTDGDEEDGYDETLVPVDYASAGQIVDDEVHDVLVRGLPAGVRLTAIMDCCHSESVLDLPYLYSVTGDLEVVGNDTSKGIAKMVGAGIKFALNKNKKQAISGLKEGGKLFMSGANGGNSAARQKTIETRSTDADVVMFSGCKDSQTSADATIGGEATGAMSYALITALNEDKNRDYTNLLRRMRQILAEKYTQVPMLSAGRKLDLNSNFGL